MDYFFVLLIEGMLERLTSPAFMALLPNVVHPDELVKANSTLSISNNISRLIGPSLGGMAIVFVGLEGVVLVDALSFVVAGTMAAFLSLPVTSIQHHEKAPSEAAISSWLKIWVEWMDGLRLT